MSRVTGIDFMSDTQGPSKGRTRRRLLSLAAASALATCLSVTAAEPASAGSGVGAGAPTCSKKSAQVVYFGTNFINWRYNKDYRWNGHYYVWSFTGDMMTWHGPYVGWQTAYTNLHYYCP